MREKILLDTDIGNDIDDALCLSYLLAQPRCDLLGITTVTGDTQARAMLADALCRRAGRDIPIFAGRREVLLEGPGQDAVPQAEVLERLEHRTSFPTEALDFLRETIRSNPGEITLLAIGPMSNVGLLFAMDPELPTLLKRTVLMIGRFFAPQPEWNALVDPFAAALLYRHLRGANVSVGLDVTLKCRMAADDVTRRLTGPLLGAVREIADVWFRHSDQIVFHDPLAGALIFEPGLCDLRRGHVSVEVHEDGSAGATRWREAPKDGLHEVAAEVDPDAFFAHYFSVFA